jgi:hypothetical protein
MGVLRRRDAGDGDPDRRDAGQKGFAQASHIYLPQLRRQAAALM